jgi:Protein of unknown function (DUF1573)
MNLKVKFILICALFFVLSCSKKADNTSEENVSNATVPNNNYAKIVFEANTFEFGKINQGEIVKHTFNFKNDSDEPLIISSAQASCGCTIPSYPKDPIAPGQEGKIDVQFNSTGKQGVQNKSITITANTVPNSTTLILKGEVIMTDTTKK